jgi:bifunctional enzyme CysN/CysC
MEHIDENALIETDILGFIERNQNKELLRFVTVGSVDDGKSTLIGRLLHDTKGVYEDQLKDATRTTDTGETAIDFARITDGLRAEREQGITIDVAYRYFHTPVRKFIIADTPGHIQYTRNMATGASTANVALILIDARLGVLQQSRRHAMIGSLLGIPHLLVCVNKMDLVDYDKDIFDSIVADFKSFSDTLDYGSVDFLPISALMGINIVERNPARTPWYDGPTVLEFLETVPIAGDINLSDFRYPVQTVIRPNLDYRGFAGQVASGVVKKGDRIKVLPSGKTSTVTHIDTWDGDNDEAFAPLSVTLRLADEIDISRGDLIVHADDEPYVGRHVEATVVWMGETPLDPGRSYVIKHTTRYVRVNVDEVAWRLDLDTLDEDNSAETLRLNDIGVVRFTTHRPLVFDPYRRNRSTGAFIIIDSMTNTTVGAAMIREPEDQAALKAGVELGAESQVSPTERASRHKQHGGVVWLTGRPASGRSSLAYALERRLWDKGWSAAVLDADDPRYVDGVCAGTGVAAAVAHRMADAGLLAIVSVEAPHARQRESAAHAAGDSFLEIFVDTPIDVCAARDNRGRYSNGTPEFDEPAAPAATIDLSSMELEAAADTVIAALGSAGMVFEKMSKRR